jgi:Flp pilus assembly CpaE family ATPase
VGTYALVSVKGSPGVTTAAVALAAAGTTDGRALVVELDPSGGSVQVYTDTPAAPGIVEVAGRLRWGGSTASVDDSVTFLPDGVPSLLAPTSGLVAASVIESASARWMPALHGAALDVVVDAGRWDPSQPSARRIAGADLVALVCRPTMAGVEHSRHLIDRLRDAARRPVVAIVVGGQPYHPADVAEHLGLPLAGTVAWDARGMARLWDHGVGGGWLRTSLARSALDTLAGLGELADEPAGAAPAPTPRPPETAHSSHTPRRASR